MTNNVYVPENATVKEMLLSRSARERYKIDGVLFKAGGGAMFTDFNAVREFAGKLNKEIARPGHINAIGMIHEIFHHVIELYRQRENPNMPKKALQWLESRVSEQSLNHTLLEFVREFPPQDVFKKKVSAEEYLKGQSGDTSHRELVLEELILLWLANVNPAQKDYRETLFDDRPLATSTAYSGIIEQLEVFFQSQPFFGPENQNLIALLRSPAISVPDSLPGQLRYIRDKWRALLGDFLDKLLSSLDLIKEEEKFGGLGPGNTPVLDFSGLSLSEEYERFTADQHWMPRLVLMAKSTHVWLDQLSKTYNRDIHRLDQVPDEELDTLAQRGFTGLWLIGVWERSQASERIKQICGNPEAMASAYSIYEYRIADNLGGEDAMNNLRHRAWQRGIRMASDMVPNHMGIDSPWVVEHPDWFLWLPHSPYPNYTFNGPDLSRDKRVGIFLEDHYYDRTDAAVVFKWVNYQNGEERYIYHGNDGTSMPWNDTAQLNYLNPEVREAVINTIFSVASQFPVIRFDAAMTLTKKHYQRLWFPAPGSGGDIPTRAGNGMPTDEFLQHMPHEFWRDVVDRFSASHSDTLLLAEAFWLMEAYFVRTLGMHRVYNSAFMNFLKNEDNAQFRASIKNVLTFNPEILKRFVNFMNNPDEETAVAQFGKDDKYFGACILMSTLPGLPMFGHGQVEGFSEKYGMEYRRAYKNETPDQHLISRHEKEIFPILKKRHLFAEVANFLIYDFHSGSGNIDENVIAYSNDFEGQASLVLVHNSFAETSGWIHTSAPFSRQTGGELQQKTLAQGLGLDCADNRYVIFRDHIEGLEYIRHCNDLADKGLFVELKAFKYHVFLDFRQVQDGPDRVYARLTEQLNGKGVPSVHDTLRRSYQNPLKTPFHNLLKPPVSSETLEAFLQEVQHLTGAAGDMDTIVKTCLTQMEQAVPGTKSKSKTTRHKYYKPVITVFIVLEGLRELLKGTIEAEHLWYFLEDWLLDDELQEFFENEELVPTVRLMISFPGWKALFNAVESGTDREKVVKRFFQHSLVQQLLQVNRHEGVLWFHKESAEQLFTLLRDIYRALAKTPLDPALSIDDMLSASEYRLDALMALLLTGRTETE